MSSSPVRGRCVCGCAHAPHQRPGRGNWCGRCGRTVCNRWIPMAARDTAILTAGQRVALALSDAQMWRTLWALHQHTQTRPRRAALPPAAPPGARPSPQPVYPPAGAIPAQRTPTRAEMVDAALESARRRRRPSPQRGGARR